MESHSNDSSSDSDSSPITDKMAPNQSDSGSQEETAYSILSPSKSLSESVALNLTQLSKENLIRTTSISSTNSDSLKPNLPGKRAPARETHNFQELDPRESEAPSDSKRITRSSHRREGVSSTEQTQDQINKGVKTNKLKKLARKSNRKLRSKIPLQQPELRESEYSSEAEDTPPLPPLVLMVSIPIENSSVNGEDSPAQSDVASELSEPTDTCNLALHHKGKDIGNLDEEYSSKDSVDNGSSERSNSIVSSQEDSGEERSKEVTSGDLEDAWKHQGSSRSGDESLAESSSEEPIGPAVSHKTTVGNRRAESNRATDNSGKSIPSRRRRAGDTEQQGSPVPNQAVKTTNKRALKRTKIGSSKDEIRKRIKHVIQLDQEVHKDQLETVLLESYHTLKNRDQQAIFCSPVTDDIAPGYSKLITQPMDFSRMKDKIETGGYTRVEELFDDFLLMCQNAMTYNKPTTYYYRAAKRIKEAGTKNLEKLARSYIISENKSKISSRAVDSHDQTEMVSILIVSIDRSKLSGPLSSKRLSLLSPEKTAGTQENESETPSQTGDLTTPVTNIECTRSKLTIPLGVTSLESEDSRQIQSGMDTEAVNADTSLLPPPSSYQSPHAKVPARIQPTPTDRVTDVNNTGINTRDIATSKKQPTLMEIKQRKFNRKREQTFQKMYTRATQARRIYGGSLAPVRPLSYGSFASFAPSYDSSFANINCQETDRVYSIVDQRELKEYEDTVLYTSFDNEVSPYYLRLADGLLNLDREKSSSDTSSWLRRTERTSTPSQDQIRTNSLRKQACQGRRMDFSFESGLSSKMQQQLDEMLQQSADLISSLNQKQGRDEHDQEQGVGEDLDKISKILMTIGAAIKTNESS